jgi:hypothetical protein
MNSIITSVTNYEPGHGILSCCGANGKCNVEPADCIYSTKGGTAHAKDYCEFHAKLWLVGNPQPKS